MQRAELIAKIVECYPKLTSGLGYPCAYGIVDEDGKVLLKELPNICHASLDYQSPGQQHTIYTSYREGGKEWFDFLQSYLFKKWGEHLHLDDTGDEKYPYIIRITGLDVVPANVVMNMCIATRTPLEYAQWVTKWRKFVELGVHPAFAFMLCRTSVVDLDTVVDNVGHDIGHFPVDLAADLSLLMHGPNVKNLAEAYCKAPGHSRPTNLIWNGKNPTLKALRGQTVRDFCTLWKQEHDEDILLAS